MFQGVKVPGSELSRVILELLLQGGNWPGSEKARYREESSNNKLSFGRRCFHRAELLQRWMMAVTFKCLEWYALFRDDLRLVMTFALAGRIQQWQLITLAYAAEKCILEDRRATFSRISAELSRVSVLSRKLFVNILNSVKCLWDGFQNNWIVIKNNNETMSLGA